MVHRCMPRLFLDSEGSSHKHLMVGRIRTAVSRKKLFFIISRTYSTISNLGSISTKNACLLNAVSAPWHTHVPFLFRFVCRKEPLAVVRLGHLYSDVISRPTGSQLAVFPKHQDSLAQILLQIFVSMSPDRNSPSSSWVVLAL